MRTAKSMSGGEDLSDADPEEDNDAEDRALYNTSTQFKLEFKKYLRLQKEGLVNLKEIFQKL
jgi:hypothetical protein